MTSSPPPDGGRQEGDRAADDPRPASEGSPARTKNPWLIPLILGATLVLIIGALFVTNLVGATDEPAGEETEPADETPSAGESETPNAEPSDTTGRQVNTTPLEELLDPVIVETGYELSEEGWSPHQEPLDDGAREAVTGVYTDGSTEVTATAAAFDTLAAQDAYAEQLVGQQPVEDLTNEGTVYIDDTGYFWAFEHENGQATIIWRTDIGVVLSVSGEASAAEEVFANMSI